MSDSLNLIFLFARLPRLTQFNSSLIALSRRLCVEFLNLIVATQAVRKVWRLEQLCRQFRPSSALKDSAFKRKLTVLLLYGLFLTHRSHILHLMSTIAFLQHASNSMPHFSVLFYASKSNNYFKFSYSLYRLNGLDYPPKLSVRVEPDPTSYYGTQYDDYFQVIFVILDA